MFVSTFGHLVYRVLFWEFGSSLSLAHYESLSRSLGECACVLRFLYVRVLIQSLSILLWIFALILMNMRLVFSPCQIFAFFRIAISISIYLTSTYFHCMRQCLPLDIQSHLTHDCIDMPSNMYGYVIVIVLSFLAMWTARSHALPRST